MSVGTLVVRVLLVGLVPGVVTLVGSDSGPAVILLSVLAAVFECVVTGLNDMSSNGKRNRKEKNVRPLKSFPLQLAVLYIVQLWFLLMRQAGSSDTPAPNPVAEVDKLARQLDAVPPASDVAPVSLPAATAPEVHRVSLLHQSAALPPVHGVAAVPPHQAAEVVSEAPPAKLVDDNKIPLKPRAKTIEEGFELEAPPQELRWTPRTISVVLPCAEERDLALKTVESVWKQTPEDVLHEIVVVDDGSNPPLSHTHLTPELQKKYKVNIQRHEQTVGLIGAKKTGGDAATGDIVVFFDCHVGPQPRWHEDFIRLISENYRRMVIPQITSLNIEDWTQMGSGGGMSKCYVTWDGDFKWGGTDDMYMGMLSGGLAGLSKRWWTESGGYDDAMLGWGGENIDQGIRMWVCGGEIVAAPNSQVAHMWRTGNKKTQANYKRIGDTSRNRARAINAWMGEFTQKLDDYPQFKSRKDMGGPNWFGDMSHFQKVKDKLQGCRPFAWYLRRFKTVYEDAGLIPSKIYQMREEASGLCLWFQGPAGTSGQGREGIVLKPCNKEDDRTFWHLGNRNPATNKCCSGIHAWNTDQCLEGGQGGGKAISGVCNIEGQNQGQHWKLLPDGSLRRGDRCLGPGSDKNTLQEGPCFSFRSRGGSRFTKMNEREPIETILYKKAQQEHPEMFSKLDALLKVGEGKGPRQCQEPGTRCVTLRLTDGSKRCLDYEAHMTKEDNDCAVAYIKDGTIRGAESGECLDTQSDADAESYVWYSCHGGPNQQFENAGGRWCAVQKLPGVDQCFEEKSWP